MKTIINKIINQSKFEISCFDGQLILKGRILTPSEAQAAGITTGLLAASLADPTRIRDMKAISDDETDENIERLIEMAKSIQPDALVAMGEAQDKIICKIISSASSDNGSTWSKLQLVEGIDQQSADHGKLWIGMIPEEDRKNILDLALQGHKRALDNIRGSL